jgi:putative PIN family toxin of toxin-antitoxin system
MLALITTHALLVAAPALPERVCRDADDDKFLALALASGTKLIVSGDKDLLAVSSWRGVIVLRPRAFADQYLCSV